VKLFLLYLFAHLLSIPMGSFAQLKNSERFKTETVFSWNNPPQKWTLNAIDETMKEPLSKQVLKLVDAYGNPL